MKTAKIKVINVVNNRDYIKKLGVYLKIDCARKQLMDVLLDYSRSAECNDKNPIDRLYPLYDVIFLNDHVNGTYPLNKMDYIWDINIDLVKEFTKFYINPLIEKLMILVKRFKTAIEESDENTIKDITGMQSSLGSVLTDRIYHSLIFICDSYDVYKLYDTSDHNTSTIHIGVSLIKYTLDQIVLKLCNNNIEYKNDIGKELYKYADAYNDLLFNLLYKLEVEFYVGDDEEK